MPYRRHLCERGMPEFMLCNTIFSFPTLDYYWCWREGALSRIASMFYRVLYAVRLYYIKEKVFSELSYDVVNLLEITNGTNIRLYCPSADQ